MFLELGACPPRDLKKPGELRSGSEVKSAWSIPLNALKPKSGTPSSQTPSSWFFLSRWHSSHFSCCDLARFRAAVPPKKPYLGGAQRPKTCILEWHARLCLPMFSEGKWCHEIVRDRSSQNGRCSLARKKGCLSFFGTLAGYACGGPQIAPLSACPGRG